MEKYYKISRQIICVLAVLISLIMCMNEDISVKIAATIFIFVVALGASFLTTPISKKMVKTGDGITNKYLRVLFYAAVLPLTLLVAYILMWVDIFIYEQSAQTINMAVLTIFLYIATTIVVIIPYVQTLIVLILRRLKDVIPAKR